MAVFASRLSFAFNFAAPISIVFDFQELTAYFSEIDGIYRDVFWNAVSDTDL